VNELERKLREWAESEKKGGLPEVVRKRLDDTLASLPERSVKKWSVVLKGAVAASVLVGGTVLSAWTSPVVAETLKKIPWIGSVFETAGDISLKTAHEKGLSTQVNKKIKIGKDEMEVKEVLYDGVRLSVGFVYHFHDHVDMSRIPQFGYPQVNGKNILSGFALEGDPVDAKTFEGILDLPDFDIVRRIGTKGKLPDRLDHFTLSLFFREKRDAHFRKLDIPVQLTTGVVKKMKAGVSKSSGDLSITVKEVQFSPISTILTLDSNWFQVKKTFSAGRILPAPPHPNFLLVDDRGIVIQNLGLWGGPTEFKATFAPMKKIPDYVTLIPFDRLGNMTNGPSPYIGEKAETLPTPDHPITLKMGEAGILRINRVEFLKDKTVVHYQVESRNPFAYCNFLYLKDKAGKIHEYARGSKVENPDTYSFRIEFAPMNPEQLDSFLTRELKDYNYRYDLAIKVPIQ
jgi:hypothetical protein